MIVVLDPIEFMRHIRVPHPFGAASGCANRQSCRFGIARFAAPEVPLAQRARSVPRPRAHLTRYHGVLAPNFKHRYRIVANPAHQAAREPLAPRPSPMRWMQRPNRVFHIDIERCEVCGVMLRVIACIDTPESIKAILPHLAVREADRIHNPRAPPLRAPAAKLPVSPRHRPCAECARGGASAALRLTTQPSSDSPPPCHARVAAEPESLQLDRKTSALGPPTDPTTTTPIFPQQRRAAGCFTYRSRRSSSLRAGRVPRHASREGWMVVGGARGIVGG